MMTFFLYIDKTATFMHKTDFFKNALCRLKLGLYNDVTKKRGGLSMISVHPGDDLQAVFDRAAPGEVLRLAPGDYRAKSAISTEGPTLEGAGADRTRIVWDDYAQKVHADGREYLVPFSQNSRRATAWGRYLPNDSRLPNRASAA